MLENGYKMLLLVSLTFYFEIILDLQKSCKESTENSLTSLNVNIHKHGLLSKIPLSELQT